MESLALSGVERVDDIPFPKWGSTRASRVVFGALAEDLAVRSATAGLLALIYKLRD
jgi:hypothetical protein